jgi:hypothetical protein
MANPNSAVLSTEHHRSTMLASAQKFWKWLAVLTPSR